MAKRVIVIGAGVVGLCVAYYARRAGLEVEVVERHGPEALGTSFGNAGMIVPSHIVPLAAPGMIGLGLRWMWNDESPFYVRPRPSLDLLAWGLRFMLAANGRHVKAAAPLLRDLHLASRERYLELSQELGGFGLETLGLLILCTTPEGLAEEGATARFAAERGIPAEVLSAAEARHCEPGIDMSIVGAVRYPLDAHLDPGALLVALRRRLGEDGVAIRWGTEVTGFEAHDRELVAVVTDGGRLPADEVVLAAGVWSGRVARQLGLRLPMQAGKGYSLTVPRPRQQPRMPMLLHEARMAVTPIGDSLRFGGTMELTGIDEGISPSRIRGIVRSVPEYFPAFEPADFEGVRPWVGLRPCSPDGLPFLGRSRRHDNLTVATGHAMMGLSLAPITGVITTDLLLRRRPAVDVTALAPDRFNGAAKL
jgi:D-amino-acid dehydrogenase